LRKRQDHGVQGQPGLHSEALSQSEKQNNTNSGVDHAGSKLLQATAASAKPVFFTSLAGVFAEKKVLILVRAN
jgi:hypothetical protein